MSMPAPVGFSGSAETGEDGRPVLVTGAGGVLGRAVIDALLAQGSPARGLGRRPAPAGFPAAWARADLLTGEGLAEALAGVRAVVHCASEPRRPDRDPVALGRLTEAARTLGSPHLVFVGVAGIERAAAAGFRYYAAKLGCERALAASGLPHTVVRATQFHPFVASVLRRLDAKLAVVVPAGARLQPVAVEFVAARLAHHARSAPLMGRAPDVLGPEDMRLQDLAHAWLRAQGRRRTLVLALPLPVRPLQALAQLEAATGDRGGPSWRAWLEATGGRTRAYAAR